MPSLFFGKPAVCQAGEQAAIQNGHMRSSTDYQRMTVVQLNSTTCEQDHLAPVVKPAIRRGLVLGLLALFLLIGFRHTRHL
jgi:hypothetical protein